MSASAFKPALLVVDFQNDFCPVSTHPREVWLQTHCFQGGALAVPDGDLIADPVNKLLKLPFAFKVATQDWHPPKHISFAANHDPPLEPYTGQYSIPHPTNPAKEPQTNTAWPTHCLQNSHGAKLVDGLKVDLLDETIQKGKNPDCEMYSVFYDNFHVEDSGLAAKLRSRGITDVFVVGLAADFCVKWTAIHAAQENFRTVVVEEATKQVIEKSNWREELKEAGVHIVSMAGPEVGRVSQVSS